MNGTKIKIREMTKDEALLTHILEELHEIKGHMCNSRPFESGVALGSLMSSLCVRLDDVVKKSNKEENDEDEYQDDDDEEDDDEEDYEISCFKKLIIEKDKNFTLNEDIKELEAELQDWKDDVQPIEEKMEIFQFVIEYLLKLDHVHPSSIEFVINKISDVAKPKSYYYEQLRKSCNTSGVGVITEQSFPSLSSIKKSIFDLQELIMRLIKFNKIDEVEIPTILNILRNTGVEECDIRVLCHLDKPK